MSLIAHLWYLQKDHVCQSANPSFAKFLSSKINMHFSSGSLIVLALSYVVDASATTGVASKTTPTGADVLTVAVIGGRISKYCSSFHVNSIQIMDGRDGFHLQIPSASMFYQSSKLQESQCRMKS